MKTKLTHSYKPIPTLLLLSALLASAAAVAGAAETSPQAGALPKAGTSRIAATPSQPSARQLLQQHLDKWRSASTLQVAFTYTETSPLPLKDIRFEGKAVAKKPGQWRVDITRFRRTSSRAPWAASGNNTVSVSDGKTSSFEFIHPHSSQLRQNPLQDSAIADALGELGPLRAFFDTEAGWPWPAGATLTDVQPKPGAVKGQRVIQIAQDDAQPFSRAVFGTDGQLREVLVQKQGPKGLSSQQWTFDNLVLNKPLSDSSFAFKARPGAKPFATVRRSAEGAVVGDQAPDFTVRDLQGKLLRLSDLKGKTVVLDFWASWCWVCNQSFPATAALARKYAAQDVVFLAVAIQDSDAGLQQWLKRHSYPDIRFVIDSLPQGEDIASQLYGVKARPTHFVIDAGGKITFRHQGYDGQSDGLEAAIQAALVK